MTSVITGDIINSRRQKDPNQWLKPLKTLLSEEGKSPAVWEIYRGDNFQIEIKNPENALLMAIRIKAALKELKSLDTRMSIGIGQKEHNAKRVTEANGEAFIFSGERLDELKKDKRTLSVRSPWAEFDQEMNLYLRLGLIAMDNWSVGAAQLFKTILENPNADQQSIGAILGISQPSVSERLKRSYYFEIMDMESMYRKKLAQYMIK